MASAFFVLPLRFLLFPVAAGAIGSTKAVAVEEVVDVVEALWSWEETERVRVEEDRWGFVLFMLAKAPDCRVCCVDRDSG